MPCWHLRAIDLPWWPVIQQYVNWQLMYRLTHWGRVTHICVSKLTIISSDKGLSPGRRQAIIWTNAGILLIRTIRTNFSKILIEIQTFSLKKMRLKMSSMKRQPFCLGLNVLTWYRSAVSMSRYTLIRRLYHTNISYIPCNRKPNKWLDVQSNL